MYERPTATSPTTTATETRGNRHTLEVTPEAESELETVRASFGLADLDGR